jgi:hypothetical protein
MGCCGDSANYAARQQIAIEGSFKDDFFIDIFTLQKPNL